MHKILHALLVCVLFSVPAQAQQGSAVPGKNEMDVLPFAREFMNEKFKSNDREIPDELRATTTEKVRIFGKKKVSKTQPVKGRVSAHFGKLVLIPVGNFKGKMTVKSPSADDVTYYYGTLELADEKLDTKIVQLSTGVDYAWTVSKGADQTTFKIMDGAKEVLSLTGPAGSVKSFGFAATVRYQGNEADINVTFE